MQRVRQRKIKIIQLVLKLVAENFFHEQLNINWCTHALPMANVKLQKHFGHIVSIVALKSVSEMEMVRKGGNNN